MVAQIKPSLCFQQRGGEKSSSYWEFYYLLFLSKILLTTLKMQSSLLIMQTLLHTELKTLSSKLASKSEKEEKWRAAFCDVLKSFLETVKTVYMSLWHSGRISIQHWRTQRLSQVWRRSKGSRPALSTGIWTGLCDISIGYWLRGTAHWAPSPSRLHSVTPSF